MSSVDVNRIDNESRHPRMLDLHFALQRLRSTVSFMNTGAHPDDETSAMLAALGFRDGIDISYACANRGEGGQNDIGTESGSALGTLRTAEMERAASALDMRLYWLSTTVDDTISDFRFSKSGVETLAKWQHAHALERFVSIVRREKPDILCTTFLDIPGQHGHHRAMTQLAHDVLIAAANAEFKILHNGLALQPWTVAKLYLPAWGGGGSAYDDELPPPPATLTINADGVDELTGWSWELIGQQSRRCHLTQGMGRWVAAGHERNWSLHLAHSIFSKPDQCITDNLPKDLSQLADYAKAPQINDHLINAQSAIEEAIQAYPKFNHVLAAANSALVSVQKAQLACPQSAADQIQHRLSRKIAQLARVIRLASGISVHAVAANSFLRPGTQTDVNLEVRQPDNNIANELAYSVEIATDDNWSWSNDTLLLADAASPTDPYPSDFFPDNPRLPAVSINLNVDGIESRSLIDMVNKPLVLPNCVVNLTSPSVVINRQSNHQNFSGAFSITIEKCIPDSATVSISAPSDWAVTTSTQIISVEMPQSVEPGLYELDVLLDGKPAQSERIIDYPHAQARILTTDAKIKVLVLDVALPNKRIAYVGGGNDHVAEHIRAMGLEVEELDDDALYSSAELDKFDTLVVGLFAMRTRPALSQNIAEIHQWIENGGHLLTLYHRPWDNWKPETIPPRFLEIGQPSLRFRVTDEAATVTHLLPGHPLLNSPNKITGVDWLHWHKERGLYFAKKWHEDYQALLSMRDPDEDPLTGSLLSADIGKGRHTHTSLILHHQMSCLVPGSYRLMANLLD